MINLNLKRAFVLSFICILIISGVVPAFSVNIKRTETNNFSNIKYIEFNLSFSYPEIVEYGKYLVIRVKETNYNKYVLYSSDPGKPVLPVNISTFNLKFGSKIIDISYENATAEDIDLPGKIAYCKASYDKIRLEEQNFVFDQELIENKDPYPSDWISFHTGGGLVGEKHISFLVTRVFPVRYYPSDNQVKYISSININISYIEPLKPILKNDGICDLLIISPSNFGKHLKPLVEHKKNQGLKTKLVFLDYIYNKIWYGRDKAEKIKLFIKNAIEESGINYVLLVGGRKAQTWRWSLPIRYSHVVPTEEGESNEKSFISDLYFADIYDSEAEFSSWDSDKDNIFSLWNYTHKDKVDLYPDVYLGRLACRSSREVKIMVDKIIKYEKEPVKNQNWFENLVLVAGDSYNDSNHFNEGKLISEKAIELMPDFKPIRVYANETQDINRDTVNSALNTGAGFAYFCGHGSVNSWSTHYPPNGTEWTSSYKCGDMIYLENGNKLPVTVVGGCHNGQFDVTMRNLIKGFLEDGFQYFSTEKGNIGGFWHPKIWIPNCWAWWLTSQIDGGSIATIANTGLGTHGDGDLDNNSVADYLEILDGWLELNFLKMYGTEGKDILGENHGGTLTSYLHRFLGDETKVDVKMVQQWQLFGDPSLKIGGYS